jgi:hypothetical protein
VQKFARSTSERSTLPEFLAYSRRGDIAPVGKITPQLIPETSLARPFPRAQSGAPKTVFGARSSTHLKTPKQFCPKAEK